MGLVGVLSTQLWHHTFIDGSLADLPSLARRATVKGEASFVPGVNGTNGASHAPSRERI
jgi:hypothetical protein